MMMKENHSYFVYVMQSSSRRALYIGITGNLERRVWEHKHGYFKGFSSAYRVHRLVYFESYDDVAKATGREKQLKGWNRAKKEALITRVNPDWKDLSEEWFGRSRYEPQGRTRN